MRDAFAQKGKYLVLRSSNTLALERLGALSCSIESDVGMVHRSIMLYVSFYFAVSPSTFATFLNTVDKQIFEEICEISSIKLAIANIYKIYLLII